MPDGADGATFASPYVGQTVTVRGVVTERTREGANNGFYLQNTAATADSDPNSSDGIFVFMGGFTSLIGGYVPVVGDEISLTGKVSEFFGFTELGSATATKVGTGAVDAVRRRSARERRRRGPLLGAARGHAGVGACCQHRRLADAPLREHAGHRVLRDRADVAGRTARESVCAARVP